MPYGKKLYKNSSRVYASDIIYDEMEEKLQSEINADVKADVNILKDHDGVITGEKTYSGSVATILDAEYEMPLKDCVVDIEPVQDLHGYDNPWPAGGGANIWDEEWEVGGINDTTGEKISVDSQIRSKGYISCVPNTQYYVSFANVGTGGIYLYGYDADGNFLERIKKDVTVNDVANAVVTTPANCYKVMLKAQYPDSGVTYKNDIAINYPATVTSYSPYSNICPISGWTGCNVTRTGKNLIICDNSTPSSSARVLNTHGAKLFKGQTYTLSIKKTLLNYNRIYIFILDSATTPQTSSSLGTPTYTWTTFDTSLSSAYTFVSDSDKYLYLWIGDVVGSFSISELQMELGSVATSYESFVSTTIPISWQSSAGTVYGGTLDVTSGVLTVDKEYVEYDGSNDESWFKYNTGSSSGFAMGLPGVASGGAAKFISNYLSYIPADYTWGSYDGWFSNDGANLITGVKSVTTVANWRSYLQNSPLAFVKPLATPQTYQLTPTEVTTLLGQNNFWSDTGDISISYGGLISVIDRSIDTLTDRLDNLKSDQIKAKGMGEVEAEPGDIVTVTDAAEFPVKDLKVKIEPIQDLHGKANPYPVLEKEPYLFRQSGGSQNSEVNGYAHDVLVGGTVAWNQMVRNGNFADSSYWSPVNSNLSISDGVATFTALQQDGGIYSNTGQKILGHRYLTFVDLKGTSAFSNSVLYSWGRESSRHINITTAWQTFYQFMTAVDTSNGNMMMLRDHRTSGWDAIQVRNAMVFDLTQMLGSTIADRAYALEQATAGSGIAWLKSMGFFTRDYYPYDAGTLKSVEGLQSHDMTGFNQWDEVWENGGISYVNGENTESNDRIRSKNYIPVLPSMSYYFKSPVNLQIRYYDGNKRYIGNTDANLDGNPKDLIRVTHSNCHYIRFCTGSDYAQPYHDNICINLSDPAKNGTYEPYEGHSYPLDSDLTLRGIPKLDANNKLYYDGDTYAADGTVTRKYGIVDLGTLEWTYSSGAGETKYFLSQFIPNIKVQGNNYAIWENLIISNGYNKTYAADIYGGTADNKSYAGYDGNGIRVLDTAYIDGATFKAAMSGVYLIYELTTPTTETADPFQTLQICDKAGTEEYVTTGIIPVGHSTTYGNICPIEGRTGCNVTRTGKNIADPSKILEKSGWTESNGVYSGVSTNLNLLTYEIPDGKQACIQLDYYGNSANRAGYFRFEYADATLDYIEVIGTTWTHITGVSNANKILKKVTFGYSNSVTMYIKNLQIEFGSTATAYEPGHVVTLPISWQSEAGTVYGGTLDVTSGVLTQKMAIVDLGTMNWTCLSLQGVFDSGLISDCINSPSAASGKKPLTSKYVSIVPSGIANLQDKQVMYKIDGRGVYIKDTAYTDAATLKTAMSGVQLVYELATPQTYQLTSEEVTTLLGQNNIWADCGPIESLTYIGTEATNVQNEIDEFENKLGGIQKSISAIQDNMTTIRNYEPNEFVTVGKNLYIITANVSKGVSLIEGTNCRETTVMEQITNLLNIIASQNS